MIHKTEVSSSERMEARRKGNPKVLKEKNRQLRILYPAKISWRDDGKIKMFSNKEKPRESVASRPAPKGLLTESHSNRLEMIQAGNLQYWE